MGLSCTCEQPPVAKDDPKTGNRLSLPFGTVRLPDVEELAKERSSSSDCNDLTEDVTEAKRLLENALALQRDDEVIVALEQLRKSEQLLQSLEASATPSDAAREQITLLRRLYDDNAEVKMLLARQTTLDTIMGKDLNGTPSPTTISDRSLVFFQPLESIEIAFTRVLDLCRRCRLFEAADALKKLEQTCATAQEHAHAEDSDPGGEIANLLQRLATDPLLVKMHAVEPRMRAAVNKRLDIRRPRGPDDSSWHYQKAPNPAIHPEFYADIYCKFAEGDERDKAGPQTQLLMYGIAHSYPLGVAEFVSIYRETDLYQKEWVSDAEVVSGKVSGVDGLYSSLNITVLNPPMLPLKFEVVTIREFAVCVEPLPGYPPGVLVIDKTPPKHIKDYAGWQLPDHFKGCTRLALDTMLYFTPHPTDAGRSEVYAFAKFEASVPEWFLPLTLLKRIAANHFVNTFQSIALHVKGEWDRLEYKNRIAATPSFYADVANLRCPPAQTSLT